jgi:two-component system, OmpR family, phosphate regulon response regulator PhoB
MQRPKALIVEDDSALAELLVWHFKEANYDVRCTHDGYEAMLLVKENVPDVILLDWMIENLPGIEVCRQLRRLKETAQVPIIMLTARGHEDDKIRGLSTGADDYMTKPFSPRELLARVDALLRRSRPVISGSKLQNGDLELDPLSFRVRRNGRNIHLGPTEFRLLAHFMERPKRVHSRFQLLDAVWGMDSHVDIRTVDVHIRRLRKSINSTGEMDPIRTVRTAGYAFDLD